MQYRTLGRTGLEVSIVSFGAIKLPRITQEESTAALNRALDLGVNFVDTARGYRDSETKIGIALQKRRDEYILATKTPTRDAAGAMENLEASLKELRTDVIDLWQLHSVSDPDTFEKVMAPGGAAEALVKAKEQGKVRHIGVTSHRSHEAMRRAITCGLFETIMLCYNALDSEAVEPEILPLAKKHNVGVIVMKALSGGALSTPPEEGSEGPLRPDPIVVGSLRYVVSNDAVTTVIPGIERVAEIEDDAAVGDAPLPMTEAEKDALLRRIGGLRRDFRYGQVCLRCGYCQPCPEGVLVPEILRAADMYQRYPKRVKYMGVEAYQAIEVGPEHCEQCGECEEQCPAGLPVREKLKEVAALFAKAD